MNKKELNCPMELTLALIGNKWKPLIVRDLLTGTKRFCELKRSNPSISQKVLTDNLRAMEEDGLLVRKIYAQVPAKVEYTLTDAGKSLSPLITMMQNWGVSYKSLLKDKILN